MKGSTKLEREIYEQYIILKKYGGDITKNGEWELKNIPAGTFDLQLDANNFFTPVAYEILEGTKQQTLVIVAEQVVEVNLTVKKL